MDIEQLDRVYKQNSWLITKTSGKAGLKAATLGSETLEALIVAMADNYGLDEADRQRLFPLVAIDVHQGVVKTADFLVKTPQAIEAAKIANEARKTGTVIKTLKAGVTGGLKAAKAATKAAGATGKAVTATKQAGRLAGFVSRIAPKVAKITQIGGKPLPVVRVVTTVYAVGTAGWFATRGRKFNKACYSLRKSRIDAENGLVAIVGGDDDLPVAVVLGSPLPG